MNAPSPLPDSADHWPTPVEPPNFQFIEESLGLEVEEGALEAAGGGCSCSEGACSLAAGCECCRRNPLGPLYDGAGRLIVFTHRTEQDDTIFECGPSCSCGAQCGNAITQRGARPRLRLAELPGKGWGVLADEPISAGKQLCCAWFAWWGMFVEGPLSSTACSKLAVPSPTPCRRLCEQLCGGVCDDRKGAAAAGGIRCRRRRPRAAGECCWEVFRHRCQRRAQLSQHL